MLSARTALDPLMSAGSQFRPPPPGPTGLVTLQRACSRGGPYDAGRPPEGKMRFSSLARIGSAPLSESSPQAPGRPDLSSAALKTPRSRRGRHSWLPRIRHASGAALSTPAPPPPLLLPLDADLQRLAHRSGGPGLVANSRIRAWASPRPFGAPPPPPLPTPQAPKPAGFTPRRGGNPAAKPWPPRCTGARAVTVPACAAVKPRFAPSSPARQCSILRQRAAG